MSRTKNERLCRKKPGKQRPRDECYWCGHWGHRHSHCPREPLPRAHQRAQISLQEQLKEAA